jgi:hypothetical protein
MRSPEGARAASYIAVTARVARRRVLHTQGVSIGISGYMPAIIRNARRDARPSTQPSSVWEADHHVKAAWIEGAAEFNTVGRQCGYGRWCLTGGDDERQRVLVLGTNVDEVDVQMVDFGDKVRHAVEPCLDVAPVVLCRPIAREFCSVASWGPCD